MAGPKHAPCKTNFFRFCHTDLAANALNRGRLMAENRRFGLADTGGATGDGYMAQELRDAGWKASVHGVEEHTLHSEPQTQPILVLALICSSGIADRSVALVSFQGCVWGIYCHGYDANLACRMEFIIMSGPACTSARTIMAYRLQCIVLLILGLVQHIHATIGSIWCAFIDLCYMLQSQGMHACCRGRWLLYLPFSHKSSGLWFSSHAALP